MTTRYHRGGHGTDVRVFAGLASLVLATVVAGCESREAPEDSPPNWMSFECGGELSLGACSAEARYVRPGGLGDRSGSDWGNALDGLPDRLERGTTYWLAEGMYGGTTFDDGAAGDAGITIRKATDDAHGTNVGWDARYGSGPAVFGPIRFSAERYTIDGGEPNGIRIVGKMGTEAVARFDRGRVVLRRVDIDGGVETSGDMQTAGACIGADIDADYVVFDQCEVHNVADDGIGIYASHVKVLRSVIHDLHGCGTDSHCSGPCYNGHSDGLELSGAHDVELVGNLIYDVRSTGAIFMEDWGSGGISRLVAYNNIFYTPSTSLTVYLQDLHDAELYNNVIWGRPRGPRFGGLAIGKDVANLTLRNNIILNINYSHMGAKRDPTRHDLDYNVFAMVDAREYAPAAHDTIGDPRFRGILVSEDPADHEGQPVTVERFRLSPDSPALDTGLTLDAVAPEDMLGQPRPGGPAWDRGPLESTR